MIVSAKKEDIDKIRGLGLGADDYMTKPFSPSELLQEYCQKPIIRPDQKQIESIELLMKEIDGLICIK